MRYIKSHYRDCLIELFYSFIHSFVFIIQQFYSYYLLWSSSWWRCCSRCIRRLWYTIVRLFFGTLWTPRTLLLLVGGIGGFHTYYNSYFDTVLTYPPAIRRALSNTEKGNKKYCFTTVALHKHNRKLSMVHSGGIPSCSLSLCILLLLFLFFPVNFVFTFEFYLIYALAVWHWKKII